MPDPHSHPGPVVVAVRHWLVHVPFTAPIAWSSGTRSGPTRLVVEITTDGGIRGYGETICLLDSIEPVLVNVVLPLAIGKGVDQVENLVRHVLGAGYYHHKRAAVMALCAVEMAMWDALGRHAGQPLHRLWGGAYRTAIDFSAYLFINEPARLAEVARTFAQRGYRSFKLKIGADRNSDIALTRAVRLAIGEGVPLRVDVNGAWTPGTAKRQCAKLAIEQGRLPVPTAPGLGVDVDPAQLDRYRVDRIAGAYLDPQRPGWFPVKPSY